jgi:hypothetical protein
MALTQQREIATTLEQIEFKSFKLCSNLGIIDENSKASLKTKEFVAILK